MTQSGTVTLLFTDLVNSTQLLSRTGDESGQRIFDAHHKLLSDAVTASGGKEVKWLGDGLMVAFPSAADAVRCAIAMQQRAWRAPGERLQVRVGLHVGEAIKKESDYFGTAVVIARRLCERASAGQILCSRLVAGLLAGHQTFSFQDLGAMELKGFSTPTDACEVLYERGEPAALPQLALSPSPARGRIGGGKRRAIAAGAGALLVAAAIVVVARSRWFAPAPAEQPAAQARAIRSIAVLPLDNFSGDPNQEYFADGMTDELITDLAKISALRVISRSSVMQFKGEHRKPLPEIARMLSVDAVVEGSVLRIGDKVRITAQLIDAPADKHLWAESYERDSRDVLALQDELASAIANEINVELTPGERQRLASAKATNPDALDAVLKGNYYLGKGTRDGFQKAQESYERAIKIDPSFAPGYAGLAARYMFSSNITISNKEAVLKAREPLQEALRLDDSLADAHALLAFLHWGYEYDWTAGERENRRAIALAPGDGFAHASYGAMLIWQGRFDEAEHELKLAQLLSPLVPAHFVDMGILLNCRGDYQKAMEQFRRALQIDPNFPGAHFLLGVSYEHMGDHAEALKELQKAVALEPIPEPISFLGWEYARSGNREQARKVIEQLNRPSTQLYVSPVWPARIYLALGDKKTALDLLEKGYEERAWTLCILKVDKIFDPLRSEPRFIALPKKVGLDK